MTKYSLNCRRKINHKKKRITGEMLVENFNVKMETAGSLETFLPLIPVDLDLNFFFMFC